MLAVGIHDQRVSEALRHRVAQTGQHGRAFAAVARQHEYAQAGLMLRHRHHRQVAAVGAAIDDHKHRPPVAQHLGHDPGQARTGVVGRQKDEMRGRRTHGRNTAKAGIMRWLPKRRQQRKAGSDP